ncbi:MAG: hypothetical protein ACRD1T_27280 [Acidimicrobiia bacterium]
MERRSPLITSGDTVTTPFQKECRQACEAVLSEILPGWHAEFVLVTGKHESYYKAEVHAGARSLGIFIYDDEAGFLIDGKDWSGFEKPDYRDSADLIDAFSSSVRRTLLSA